MVIKKIYLENFLSYPTLFLELNEGVNVLTGANAAGKTNLIESIFFAAIGKSARGLKDKELISWQSNKPARIKILVEKKYSKHTVEIQIDQMGKKRALIDGLPVQRMSELLGGIGVVFFSPDEMKLIKESPVDRRRFMDISLCQLDKIYLNTLMRYNKLLAQRNKVLKTYKNSHSLKEMSDLIVDKMVDCTEYIILRRQEFLTKLAPLANEKHLMLTGGKESLEIAYETEDIDFSDMKNSLSKLYEKNMEKDCRLEYTSVGIHRDDIKISAGDIDVRKYCSQGQKRTAALSLKLAEVESFYTVSGEKPVLLMDDVLSELDCERRKCLFDSLNAQTIVTCTEFEKNIADKYTLYEVKDRKISLVRKTDD